MGFFSGLLKKIKEAFSAKAPAATASCPVADELQDIADAVNPEDSNVNCGNIIDAVIDRLNGSDPLAVAPAEQDGSFDEIAARHGTALEWGHSFDEAFDAINAAPEGTVAVLGIDYGGGGGSHVVVITKQDGVATIVEAQNWGPDSPRETITTAERANERYNPGGTTTVGYGVLP